jgi:DNA-binding response OmpR family regulator
MSSILIVEADAAMATYRCDQLAADDFSAAAVGTVEGARRAAAEHAPTLLLLGGPAEPRSALALLGEVRAGRWPFDPWLPALVLTATPDELEVLRAFRYGADDVMAKPAGYPELRARIAALLRRASPHRCGQLIRVGGLDIDTRARAVTLAGAPVELTDREFDLLAYLARDPERVFTKDELIAALWGDKTFAATRTLDTHACRLREKLTRTGDRSWVINVWGVGYALRHANMGRSRGADADPPAHPAAARHHAAAAAHRAAGAARAARAPPHRAVVARPARRRPRRAVHRLRHPDGHRPGPPRPARARRLR